MKYSFLALTLLTLLSVSAPSLVNAESKGGAKQADESPKASQTFQDGYKQGYRDAYQDAYRSAYREGHQDGYALGYSEASAKH